jgi:TolB protein
MFARLISILILMAVSSSASARLEILITEGVNSARSVGIVPFKWLGKGAQPENFSEIVAADLQRSGKFNPLAISKMLKQSLLGKLNLIQHQVNTS